MSYPTLGATTIAARPADVLPAAWIGGAHFYGSSLPAAGTLVDHIRSKRARVQQRMNSTVALRAQREASALEPIISELARVNGQAQQQLVLATGALSRARTASGNALTIEIARVASCNLRIDQIAATADRLASTAAKLPARAASPAAARTAAPPPAVVAVPQPVKPKASILPLLALGGGVWLLRRKKRR